MAINKLNKNFVSEQVLTSSEMNQITKKIDEIVDGVNTNASNIPDVSGFITTSQADGKYQPKGQYATTTQLNTKADKIAVESVSESTKQLQPNKYYVFGEVATLTITLAAGESNKLAEYMFEFTSGTTPTTLTDIDGVEWKGDTIEANKIYQASISRGIGILIGRTKA